MTYEYECGPCKDRYEITMTLAEYERILSGAAHPPTCRSCKAELTKIITQAPDFQLKGSGWAKDGYASNGDTNAN